MIRRYTTDDYRDFERPPRGLFAALLDFENWNRWWPRSVRFRVVQLTSVVVGSKLEALPFGKSVFLEVASVEPEESLVFVYRAGPYRGKGEWSVEEIEETRRLRYRSELDVHPSLIGEHFMSQKDFSTKHAKLMRGVFDGLTRWLEDRA